MSSPESHSDVIGLWPSVAEFARAIEVTPASARMMKSRNQIPPKYFREVVLAAHRDLLCDLTYARLAELAKPASQP